MYYLFIVALEGCGYCKAALDLLNSYKIKYKSIIINYKEKDKYVTSEINTFPQIYLKKDTTNDSLLLGGFSQLKSFCDAFIDKKYNANKIKEFNKLYPLWNKKAILRLIEIFHTV